MEPMKLERTIFLVQLQINWGNEIYVLTTTLKDRNFAVRDFPRCTFEFQSIIARLVTVPRGRATATL
jgi:hypothetical protein